MDRCTFCGKSRDQVHALVQGPKVFICEECVALAADVVAERGIYTAHHYQVSITAPSADEANRLGRTAVEERLAACAQVSGPLASTYWWQDEVSSAEEWVCILKTTTALVAPLIDKLRAAHSYETPEIIATPIEAGDLDYLAWIDQETRGARKDPRQ